LSFVAQLEEVQKTKTEN